MPHQISRRTLLRGMGTAIALPFLEAMLPPTPLVANVARSAAESQTPVRMAFLYVPNGMHMPDWTPTGPGDFDFELQSIMEPVKNLKNNNECSKGAFS